MADYQRYYQRYRYQAILRFLLDACLTRNRWRRISLANRQRDYLRLADQPELLILHRVLNLHLDQARSGWGSYDYGEGYFYQGCDRIGITGLRNSETRIEAMELRRHVAGKRVLEIGCNSGFIGLSLAAQVDQITGFDINPHMIAIARAARDYLGLTNLDFQVSSFEAWPSTGVYDAVLSFANHHTYDNNTAHTLEAYFDRCRDLLAPGGVLLFESHPPEYEGEGIEKVCRIIAKRFTILEWRILGQGTVLDRGRTFIVASR